MLRKMRLLLFIMLASLFVTACGQKGDLYKSPEPVDNKVAPQPVSSNVADKTLATDEQTSILQQE
ncbi:MAG: lipoprotein [Shewanella sp.]|uniref:Lipoprotein n=2 Tax=Shewanellaceae TaxID=267890 RepID=A0ABT5TS11_9GAMM|nr:lipoprotein [Shewanella metallivivens]MDD8061038.1 lipoprotein [Shewanella metallivivens]